MAGLFVDNFKLKFQYIQVFAMLRIHTDCIDYIDFHNTTIVYKKTRGYLFTNFEKEKSPFFKNPEAAILWCSSK